MVFGTVLLAVVTTAMFPASETEPKNDQKKDEETPLNQRLMGKKPGKPQGDESSMVFVTVPHHADIGIQINENMVVTRVDAGGPCRLLVGGYHQWLLVGVNGKKCASKSDFGEIIGLKYWGGVDFTIQFEKRAPNHGDQSSMKVYGDQSSPQAPEDEPFGECSKKNSKGCDSNKGFDTNSDGQKICRLCAICGNQWVIKNLYIHYEIDSEKIGKELKNEMQEIMRILVLQLKEQYNFIDFKYLPEITTLQQEAHSHFSTGDAHKYYTLVPAGKERRVVLRVTVNKSSISNSQQLEPAIAGIYAAFDSLRKRES